MICLISDSEESVRSAMNEADEDDADFNFPPVDFTYHDPHHALGTIDKPNEEVNQTPLSVDRAGASRLSELLEKYSNKVGSTKYAERKTKNKPEKTRGTSPGSESHDDDGTSAARAPSSPDGPRNRRHAKHKSKTSVQSNSVRGTRDKSQTRPERPCRTNLQPGECSSSLSVSLDEGLKRFSFYSALVDALRESDVSCRVDSLPVENSIVWTMTGEDEGVAETDSPTEKEMLVVWNFDETARRVSDGSFASSVQSAATLMPGSKIILVLYGTESYFRYQSNSAKQRSNNRGCGSFDGLPKISKWDLETCLAEAQLLVNCNSMLIDTLQDFNALVLRLTKAVVEKPAKLLKRLRLENGMDWYAMGDNKDTVRVDKNGNGLKRLWQHQLRQFSLGSLEASEAISSVYPSPFKLMQVRDDFL